MINDLLKRLQRPEWGWDPVPLTYAREYEAKEYASFDPAQVDCIERWAGRLDGKSVIDLGGGPGHYSIEMARRGATVRWHDVSRNYLEIARRRALESCVEIEFSLGYMEEALGQYDLVFNRVCWYYCVNDRAFARKIVTLVKPGGSGYLVVNTDRYIAGAWRKMNALQRLKAKALFQLNDRLSVKVGHVMPSHRRINELFNHANLSEVDVGHVGEMTCVRFHL